MTTRRDVLTGFGFAALLGPAAVRAADVDMLSRPIPSSGERVPVIGMGTSRTFDVGSEAAAREPLAQVLAALFAGGGTLIDSSPMYGRAEQVTGDLLAAMTPRPKPFLATKVWTNGREAGIAQMQESMRRLEVDRIDLMQIHNLRDWRVHLPVLREWQAAGTIRHIGITTSFVNQHAEFADVMRAEKFDFVQINYSIGERESEQVLLPLARDRGCAVLVNRPFMKSELFRRVAGKPLPPWSAECDCASWGQFLLKWVVAHPDVTCAIPASARPSHMADNMLAGVGRLPDLKLRQRMADYVSGL